MRVSLTRESRGEIFVEKEDFNIMYRETCPFIILEKPTSELSASSEVSSRFLPPGSSAYRFSDDVPAGMLAESGRAEDT